MKQTQRITKRYTVEIPGSMPVVIRQTSTMQHAIKHAAYASELRITVVVRDNVTKVTILEIPAIDAGHAVKARCKRDKRYAKQAREAEEVRLAQVAADWRVRRTA